METGKTIAKSSKAVVYGGTCQWTESFSETIWVYQDDLSKEFEECLYKISVAMGSARSGILGELILNLTDYMKSRDSGPISLPLKKCNYGTILQIKIQCYPKTRSRDRNTWKEPAYRQEDLHSNDEEKNNRSDGSDTMLAKSLASSSGSHLGITSSADQIGKEPNLSAPGSHRSSDSGEGSVGRTTFSPIKSSNGGIYMGRQESAGSQISATSGAGPDDVSRSNQSSFNSRASDSSYQTNHWQEITSQLSAHGTAPLSLRLSETSKELLEAAEETIEELHDEAKMWERHSQKVKHDLEMLKKESSEKSKHLANLEMELSSACVERDSLKQEVIQLQASMKGLMAKQNVMTTAKIDDMIRIQNALEDELRFQKESNTNLNLQMKRTQEANIELVSILQELEETVERQNLEIANLSQNSQIFEQEDDPRSQALLDIETEWESKLTSKEEEIIKLEEKLSDILNAQRRGELVCDEGDPEMTKEIEALKTKVHELERDCTELTEENLELIFKMKETRNNAREEKPSHQSTYHESKNNISHDHSEFMIGLLKPEINHVEQDLRKKEMLNDDLTIGLNIQIKGLEEKCTDLEIELQHFKEQSCHLDTELQKSQAQVKEKLQELTELQQKLGNLQDTDTRYFDIGNGAKHVEIEACSTMEISGVLSEVYEQLHLAMIRLRNLCHDGDSDTNSDCVNDNGYVKPSSWDTSTQKEQAEAVLNDFLELNRLLGDGIVERKSLFRDMGAAICHEDVISTEGQQHLNSNRLREKTSKELLVGPNFGNDTDEEMVGRKSEIEELESRLLLKDKEIDSLEHSVRDLEDLLSDIEREKSQLEENVEVLELSNRDLEDLVSGIQKEKGLLEENLEVLEQSNKDLEDLISGIQREKGQLEEKLADALRERSTSSKCLDDVRHDLMELTRNMEAQVSINKMLENKSLEIESSKKELKIQLSELEVEKAQLSEHMSGLEAQLRNLTSEKESHIQELEDSKSLIMDFTRDVESHVSTNKMLERKSLELESIKSELETHLSGLEVENAQLSKHISGLEAQLIQLSSEKETTRLDLEDSKTLILDLKDEFLKQQTDREAQISELKQKLQEAHKQLLEAQEETEYLKRTRSKLQATVKSLTEECDSVQKLNGGLRKQKLELHERCTHVEVELEESEKKGIEFCRKVECLELELSSLQKDTDSKEKSLISQVECIFQEHQKHEAKLSQAHLILNQMESAKAVELDHLKREIAHLTLQVSSSHDEQEGMKSDAVREVFNLRLDKSKLETSLQEADAKVKLYETEINSLRQESGNKVQGLVDLLNSSKQTEEILMADIQRMQSLMVSVKTSEEKFRTTTNELEVKLKASDYEKQQVLEEISSLKVKLEKMARLQEELSTLEHSLDEEKFEKGKLERSLHSVSEECEELKKQRVSFMEKISNMQNALRDAEDDRRSRIALEEKLLMLERDLNAREASGAHEAELKDELNRIKRTHSECQRKIQCLEEEKGDFLKRAHVLEQELMLKDERNHDEAVLNANGVKTHTTEPHDVEQPLNLVNDMQHLGADQHDKPDHMEGSQVGKEVDLKSKIHTLENELAQALETSNMYKVQLTSILTEQQTNDAAIPKETVGSNDPNIDDSSRIASLEVELKEMQERYLHMSLQYAEVEASREELVMQLKSSQKGKRWFS